MDDTIMEQRMPRPPNLPPTFMTIHDLRDRWLEEQERKKKELEEQVESEANPQTESVELGDRDVPEKSEVDVSAIDCDSTEKKLETEEFKRNGRKGYRRGRNKRNRKARAWENAEDGERLSEAEKKAPEATVVEEEKAKPGNGNVADGMLELEEKLGDMSIDVGEGIETSIVVEQPANERYRRWNNSNYRRGNNSNYRRGNYSNYRRGSVEHYRGSYRRYDGGRREERNPKMVWVKKGEVPGADVGGAHSSSCSHKETQ